ncbi:hypothetical protein ATANTOWER_004223 [Ataeniobius toweri]|uniref:Uncharacterized protein n=1 Tax=Ataeniobius toweri TaxID=208326 RepID=A0ABU7AD41_9TELE|nr:hypothetical protein [Ataeniobius toweri]
METFSQLRKNETCCMDPLNVQQRKKALVQTAAAFLKLPSCYFPIMDLQFPAQSSGVGLMFVLIGPALQLNMDPASNPQTEQQIRAQLDIKCWETSANQNVLYR